MNVGFFLYYTFAVLTSATWSGLQSEGFGDRGFTAITTRGDIGFDSIMSAIINQRGGFY